MNSKCHMFKMKNCICLPTYMYLFQMPCFVFLMQEMEDESECKQDMFVCVWWCKTECGNASKLNYINFKSYTLFRRQCKVSQYDSYTLNLWVINKFKGKSNS